MRISKGFLVVLMVCFVTLLAVDNTDGCSCVYTHPQTHYCTSDFVVLAKIKEEITKDYTTTYKVKINRKFRLSNDSYNDYLRDGHLYTPSESSLCGVQLNIGETYIISGHIEYGKPRISICDLNTRWSRVSRRQKKGFKGLYAKGCVCDVTYTRFFGKGEALHQANGKLCPWEGMPGPTDCQEDHGICVSNQGRCFWMPSRPYDQCIREHHQTRLEHQRLNIFP